MRRSAATLDQLFDRTWRPGHPFRPRLSAWRRWGISCLLVVLLGIIAGYWYLTDTARVRRMCEQYLSQLAGGRVQVRHATLSIFEGLRLDDVSLRLDTGQDQTSEPTVFEARSVLIKYNPESILSGRLEATQILVIDPRWRLCENLDTRTWNYHLPVGAGATSRPTLGREMTNLPEITLRNGQVDYSQVQNGKMISLGSMALDGTMVPGETRGTYLFRLQSRGESEGMGPVVSGYLLTSSGEVTARLENFEFGRDIKAMLPDQVRQWWEDHELAGRVDVPVLHVKPGLPGQPPTFRVETDLNNVMLSVRPTEWLSRRESENFAALHAAFDLMRDVGLNEVEETGLRVQGSGKKAEGAVSSLNPEPRIRNASGGFVDRLESLVAPTPVKLDKVAGTFVFTQDGIDIKRVSGWIENNPFQINGRIEGYTPAAAARIEIVGDRIYIPHSPRYVNSMPSLVREFYENLHPEGTASLWFRIERPAASDKPRIDGVIDVLQGQFVLDAFPYPLRDVRGRITVGPDPVKGDRCDVDLRGYGVRGGPNRDRFLTIKGRVAPLNADAEVTLDINGSDIASEPALLAAIPPEGREALAMLDPSKRGEYPKFHGNFRADVHRPEGAHQDYRVVVTVDLTDGSGAYQQFPYALDRMTGQLVIGPGRLDIHNAVGRHGNGTVAIDGSITYGPKQPVRPKLKLTARDLTVDKDLLAAVDPARRAWLETLGIRGTLDLDGQVYVAEGSGIRVQGSGNAHEVLSSLNPQPPTLNPSLTPMVDLHLTLRDGRVLPRGSTFEVSGVAGRMHLADGKLELEDFKGQRGQGELACSGVVVLDTPGRPAQLSLSARATNLLLDAALYRLLPAGARQAWDAAQLEGTLDAELTYGPQAGASPTPAAVASIAGEPAVPSPAPAAEVPANYFALTLTPRKLAATLKSLPYRLEDLTGRITIRPQGVTLDRMSARHKGAAVFIAGTGTCGDAPSWTLSIAGKDLAADEDLRKALPQTITKLIDATALKGKVSFEFPRLVYRTPYTVSTPGGSPATVPVEPDMDIAGSLWFNDASMNIGVPLDELNGVLNLDSSIRGGKLAALSGSLDVATLKVADRPAKNLHAELFKPADRDLMRIDRLRAGLCGGELAGRIDLAFPEGSPSRFGLAMILRNVDVQQLTGSNGLGEQGRPIKGQMNASLALEGAWEDPSSRRGRGDVSVTGRDMYHIPLLLGLLQITNLSLPISSPFNEGNARFMVEGQKVTFEQIELRASNMLMQGSGSMNFQTKKVKMSFVTDNPNWPKLPLIDDLVRGAKRELLQIQVSGTIQEPKVRGSVMSTFTTTVDEVFRAGEMPSTNPDRKH